MPQTASSRTPETGAGRRSRSASFAWSASFGSSAALFGGAFGGASAALRFGSSSNRVARFAATVLALCSGLACVGALAQTPGNPIYIAGPGAQNGADAAQMSTMLNTPGRAASVPGAAPLARAPEEARSEAGQSGMITIPGPGERSAAASQASAPNIVTIPAPGAPAAMARNDASSLPRVNVGTAASRVAPVVVGSSAAGTPNNRIDNAAINAANARANVIQRYATTTLARQGAAANAGAAAVEVPPGQEDGEAIHAAALTFLQQQSVGLPGRVTVTVSPAFPRGLAACTQLETFMPPGARSWGRTTVGVRCVGAKPWTLYVAARVAVDITYYTAARQIEPGQMLSVADLVPREGDLASLPRTVITDPSQATGALALLRITAGLPLRTDMLRSASSVVIGQTVKVVAEGTNFTISAEGSALNTAAPGEQVRVRTEGGQIITGIVKDAGTVQVQI
jgi:flagellar basal body P-ring formation protein FlgA